MDRTSWKSRTQKAIIAGFVLLVAYFAFTDEHGDFDVPGSPALGAQRIEQGFASMVNYVADGTRQKNREMQQVHDNYEDRTADRVEENGGEAP